MKRGITISAVLHILLISAALFSAPFSIKKKPFDYEVIKINAVSPMAFEDNSPAPIEEIVIPEPSFEEESFDIPIDDPTSVDKPVVIDKPKVEKPKPKPKKENKKPTKKPKKPPVEQPTGTGKEIDTKNTSKGSAFAGARVDNSSFDYPYWFDLAFNKISYNWHNTTSIDGPVVCVIKFEVIKSGKVISKGIESSSGVPAFDQTCLDAITRSNPFPPLPNDFRDEIISITLPFKNQ